MPLYFFIFQSELFQVDLYPPTMSSTPALTAEEWFSGFSANPIMMSMQTGCEILNEHADESVIFLSNYIYLFTYLYNYSSFRIPLILGLG
jgi:hypothetical protein